MLSEKKEGWLAGIVQKCIVFFPEQFFLFFYLEPFVLYGIVDKWTARVYRDIIVVCVCLW